MTDREQLLRQLRAAIAAEVAGLGHPHAPTLYAAGIVAGLTHAIRIIEQQEDTCPPSPHAGDAGCTR